MEIQRKIYSKLLQWKQQSNENSALLLEGTKSVGKSTIAKEFGNNEYRTYVIIDFNIANNKILNSFSYLDDLDKFF